MTSRLTDSRQAIVPVCRGEIDGRAYWFCLPDGYDVSATVEYGDGTPRTLAGMGQW